MALTAALITDGNRRPALASLRSLARRGIPVTVLADEPGSLCAWSRYADRVLPAPSAAEQPDKFVATLLDIVATEGIGLVMPMLDASLRAVTAVRSDIERRAVVAAPSPEAVQLVLDKQSNLSLAMQLGLDCAQTRFATAADDPGALGAALRWPVVVKPTVAGADAPFKVRYAHNATELGELLVRFADQGETLICQEYLVGEPRNICCLAADGEILAMHEYRSLRSVKGQGVLRELRPVSPRAADAARRLLAALRWTGLAQVCGMVDPSDDRFRYVETNGRPWSSIAGSIQAGWDFPYWAYRLFLFGERPASPSQPEGQRCCWHRGDLVALANFLLGGESPAKDKRPGRLRAIADYLAAMGLGTRADVFAWDDPLPEFADHWQLLRRAATAIFSGGLRHPNRVSRPD